MTEQTKKTIAYCVPVFDDTHILLKKNLWGHGGGKWAGFSGEICTNEKTSDAAKRIAKEHGGITLNEVIPVGKLTFEFAGDPELLETYLYYGTAVNNNCRQSRDVERTWFAASDIPFDTMWPDSLYWMPLLLKRQQFEGYFYFQDSNTIIKSVIRELAPTYK